MTDTLTVPQSVNHLTLAILREKLIKTGVKVTGRSEYVAFQLAEVAVRRPATECARRALGRQRTRDAFSGGSIRTFHP